MKKTKEIFPPLTHLKAYRNELANILDIWEKHKENANTENIRGLLQSALEQMPSEEEFAAMHEEINAQRRDEIKEIVREEIGRTLWDAMKYLTQFFSSHAFAPPSADCSSKRACT